MTQGNVYQLIAAVSADMAKEGIGKDRTNQQQGYKFRGIDDVYNALAPIISRHGLVILPRCLSRELTERTSAKGGALFNVVIDAEFDFVSAHDGTTHTVKTFGEAMDSADKATNKAMSAAYKYACFQVFCIPTEGDNDADATTHAVKPKLDAKRQPAEPIGDPPADWTEACGECGKPATVRAGGRWLCAEHAAKPAKAPATPEVEPHWTEAIEAAVHQGDRDAVLALLPQIIAESKGAHMSAALALALVGLVELANDVDTLQTALETSMRYRGKLASSDFARVQAAVAKGKKLLEEVAA